MSDEVKVSKVVSVVPTVPYLDQLAVSKAATTVATVPYLDQFATSKVAVLVVLETRKRRPVIMFIG